MGKSEISGGADDYPIGVFNSTFTGNEAFLADHVIQGKKILPGMAYLEIARAAVANSVETDGDRVIVLRDAVFIQAMIVMEECNIAVKLYPGSEGEFGVEVSTDQGVHFQSKAYLMERRHLTEGDSTPSFLDLTKLKEECNQEGPNKEQFYAIFERRGVELGPSHRGIEEIHTGKDCVLAKVSLPGSSSRGMEMDPGMLDSAIQSGFALASDPETNAVPYSVDSMYIYGPLTENMFVYAFRQERGLNYTIADETGEVKAYIAGFQTREIELSPAKDSVAYYEVEWEEDKTWAGTGDSKDLTVVSGQQEYAELVRSVFEVARGLIEDEVERHCIEVHISESARAWRGIVPALKTVGLEYPKIDFRLKCGDAVLRQVYKPAALENGPKLGWTDNRTILITGGLGGLGLLLATDIAEHTQGCTLILIGRTPLEDGKRHAIKKLEALGATVVYNQCDVSKRHEVEALIDRYPDIHGLIHASGITGDGLIVNKNAGDIDAVLAPKVKGIENLDLATADMELDYFIAFSSIASTVGNAGQYEYAAANGYMDSYVQYRADMVRNGERSGRSISINWPLWEEGGMDVSEATRKNLQQVFKIKPLPSQVGLDALKRTIGSDIPQLVVLFGNRQSVGRIFDEKKPVPEKESGLASDKEMERIQRKVMQEVRDHAAKHLKRPAAELDSAADWAEFGFDSILLSSFINKINSEYGLNLLPTVLFEATNMQAFSRYLTENHPETMSNKLGLTSKNAGKRKNVNSAPTGEKNEPDVSAFAHNFIKAYKSSSVYREKDIAIIGVSCRIAGAKNLDEFWKMLVEEKDMITEIPPDRWDWRDFPGVRKWGSFVDGVAEFDPLFFGISPVEAMYMAPEQRLMLQYVWECLEDAGYGGEEIRGTDTGLYIGCGPSDYSYHLSSLPIEAYSATGMVPSVGPNRISYLLDWHGPSNPVETACSSALVAVHRAVEALRGGHCSQAVAGGVNLLLSPDGYISFTKSGMLCEDGRCKTFSDKANGYVRGEGIGMVMLKPVKEAVRDGDTIYALVKGTAENHGGRTNSLTAPNPKSQTAVIKKAIRDSEIDFRRVSYIECHGTGTSLGDPVEIEGLKGVAADLCDDTEDRRTCWLGSIKSNIGHLEFAAGVAGLIKVILQMKHKKIARSLHCDTVNPYINLSNTPYAIAREAVEWQADEGDNRVAGISSFGFGGVNAHIVLEEFRSPIDVPDMQKQSFDRRQLLVFSARDKERLLEYVAQFPNYVENLEKNPDVLQRIAYTLQTGRLEMQERAVFIAESFDQWMEQIDRFLKDEGEVSDPNIYRGRVDGNSGGALELGDTQAGKDYIKHLIDADEVEKLAELWVKGSKVDWDMLHHE